MLGEGFFQDRHAHQALAIDLQRQERWRKRRRSGGSSARGRCPSGKRRCWKSETLPAAAAAENEVGAFVASVEPNEGGRSLIFRRRFDLVRRTLRSPLEYEKAQRLFATAEKSDAQKLVLVRE